ncbi:related to Cytokinesis protein 3 [Saccharomycodes ludwigii]|uniref:Related to Cytokinesis protein 3 n=1 Tax=Saccharomycodes ludwigii TaxID=36035 RepID=A0A376B2H5_9ASCO|nr:related to Cytokinesis protein 3 [Saccharomycodes ludwigii]
MERPPLPFKVKAIYSWSGEQRNDLGFLEGDIIEVTKAKGHWYYGKLLRNKKTGSFPANYVTVIQEKINEHLKSSSKNKLTTSKMKCSSSLNNLAKLKATGSTSSSLISSSSSSPAFIDNINNKPLPRISPTNSGGRQQKINNNISCGSNSRVNGFPISRSSPNVNRYTYENDVSSSSSSPRKSPNKSTSSPMFPQQVHHQQRTMLYSNSSSSSIDNNSILDIRSKHLPSLPLSKSHNDMMHNSDTTANHINSNSNGGKRADDYDHSYSLEDDYYADKLSFTRTKYWQNSGNGSKYNSNLGSKGKNSYYYDDYEDEYDGSLCTMSNFSATSAGSFARHKFAKSFTDSKTKQDLPHIITNFNSSIGSTGSINNVSASNNLGNASPGSGSGKFSGLFRKKRSNNKGITSNGSYSLPNTPLGKYPDLPDISQLNLSSYGEEVNDWAQVNHQLNRSNTLGGKEKYERKKRFLEEAEEDTDIILEPQQVFVQGLYTNEVAYRKGRQTTKPGLVDLDLQNIDLDYIDKKTKKKCVKDGMQSLESFVSSTFGSSAFKNNLERLRAIFVFCTETFQLVDDNGNTDFRKPPTNFNLIIHRQYCTPYELTWLFKKLANAVAVYCEIVIGFLKTPNCNTLDFQLNHCWLTVLVNDEWRFVDVILGNVSNPLHEYINNKEAAKCEDFYFLTEPLKLIHTHIPYRSKDQHVVPELDNIVPLSLPTVFPSFFTNDLKIYKYDNSLSLLRDSEVYELSLFLPVDIEIFASVVVEDEQADATRMTTGTSVSDLCLVQVKWNKNRRIAIIKAVLPPAVVMGNLHIHSGPKGLQTTLANIHPLSMIIALKHSGEYCKHYEFVRLLPSITACSVDLYVKKPQNKFLFQDYEYNLQTIVQPSDGLVYESSCAHEKNKKKTEIAIQSPSGKIYKYKKNDPNFEFGTWELDLKMHEYGIWTGLVSNDSGVGWCAYAEWTCS